MKTIVIAGGTGFLGQVLEYYFSKKGYAIKILTRNPKKKNHVYWNAKDLGNWTNNLEGIDVLINLAGKSVDCRYNDKNKKLIYNSRIDSTHVLGLAINLCEKPPKIWMNSSTATIYKYSYDKEMSEEYGEFGNDFSMNIAKSWEAAFNAIKNPKTRKIVLRISIVLGRKGGAIIPFKRLTKFGLGGKQGNGQQKVSWIHELDFSRAIDFLIEKEYKFFSKIDKHLFVTMIHRLAVIKKYLDTIKKTEIEFNNKTILSGTQHIDAIEQIFNGLIYDCLFIIGQEDDDLNLNMFKDD